jgi:glycosyltransferase involved in cell wall biosynthesis
MSRRDRIVVAVSGPDGAGKSSLAQQLASRLVAGDFSVATAYCYGCVFCRRPSHGRPRPWSSGPGSSRPGSSRPGRRSWISRCHALLDVTELMIRLASARGRAALRPGGRPVAVVTDRGPLDGLAKFQPAPGSLAAALFTAASRRYDLELLLDAPADVLAARDGDHSAQELDEWRNRYRTWARSVPSLVQLDTRDREPAVVAAEAARMIFGEVRARDHARKRVVISNYDSPGNPHYDGGGALVVDTVARGLARDFEVTVVTGACRPGTMSRDGLSYRYLPVCWAGPRAGQLLFHALLPFVAWRTPHDLWIESFTPPFSTSFIPLFSPASVVGLAQTLSGERMWHTYHLPFFLIERLGLRCYHDVVVLNPADGAVITRHNPSATVRVIPNSMDLPDVEEQSFGRGEHILFLGRIETWSKGLDLLLAAYEQSGAAMPLIIAGAGSPSEERKLGSLLAASHGDVRWLGRVDGQRKDELLRHSAFVVVPSRSETFGLVALEGMAYGKPVLHFDLPGLKWMHGDVCIPSFDAAAMSRSIRELSRDEHRRRDLGRMARATAEQFRPERMQRQYLALARQHLEPPAIPRDRDVA